MELMTLDGASECGPVKKESKKYTTNKEQNEKEINTNNFSIGGLHIELCVYHHPAAETMARP